MDSTLETVVNVAENGNSTEKELNNDVITIKVALAPKKDIDCEIESPAIKSEQNDGSDINLIESTENEVDGKSSVTESLTDIIDKETTIQSDSNEVISDTDTKTTDSAIEKLPPSKVDSELKMEASLDPQDKSKTLVDAEEQAPNVEDSEDDGEESFSEDEDPNEPTTISSELAVENYNKTEIVTPNESLNEKEKRSLEKTLHEDKKEEGLSTDHKELENGSIRSEVSIKKPNNIVDASILDQNKKLEEQIPVQSEVSDTKTDESDAKLDQKDFNNQIKDIISDIDINIKAQEKITELKEQELKLIQKQNELANQIHQQQLLAQKLNEQNQLKQQQNQWEAELESRRYQQSDRQSQPITTQPKETTNVSKTNVDLRKIFTPATDTPEILPKNRKLYASSAFYSPTLHPTVEDQVELARRISHSLSDISNQTSKGQSMYVNRKKRSVKWVHEGSCQDYQQYQPRPKAISPNILPAYSDAGKHRVQLNIHQNQLIEKYSKGGVQVVKSPWEAALQTGSASSAFLEESQGQCPTVSPPTMYHRQSTPRDLTDAAVKPSFALGMTNNQQQREEPCINSTAPTFSNPQRVLAYTPNVAQGWGGRSVELPKGLYIPKEISLSSYAPPQQKQPTFAPSQNYESTFQPIIKSNLGSSVDIQSSNGRFPLSNSNPSGYSTFSLQPNYQKVPTNNIAPQVNFNPSPLSFDKLSRYENPSVNQNQQQYQNIRQKKQVQNASPIPFGASSQPRSPICSMSSMGTSPQPQRLSSVPYHRSSNQDQSFNKLPRGWGDVQNNQHQQAYITPPTLSRNVPYTEIPYSDF